MAKLEKFEDLMAWQKARELSQAVYEATRGSAWSADRRLTEQIQSSAVATMTHTADSFLRWEIPEAVALLGKALSSAMDVRSCLYIALDAGYIDGRTFDDLQAKADNVSRMIGGWRACKKKGRSGNRASGNGTEQGNARRADEAERSDRRPAYQER